MWETSMEGLLSLIRKSTPSSFSYICEKNGGSLSNKVCFLLALRKNNLNHVVLSLQFIYFNIVFLIEADG